MTVLHLHKSVHPSTELITVCQLLKSSGFRISLGSYCWEPGYEPLVALADYIKVNFTQLTASGRRFLQHNAVRVAAALVAEKVETLEEFKQACFEGFALFQGYFFCRPELIKNCSIPANRISHIKILELLHRETVDLHEIGRWVKQDTSLTYRLLRLVNSPICAMRQEVLSIEAALMVVGEEMFRRIATLAITSELNSNRPAEILRMSFVRGRFCELSAAACGLHPTEQYLLGLLSLVPAMLCIPMEELTPGLPLRDEIRSALHGASNRERCMLQWLEAHERGDWATCDVHCQIYCLNRDHLMQNYAQALEWAEAALHIVI
jgi:EAL and modified HD-GYP domain-containing signal transduction protein